jgi:purine-binding chemotaxis protein CheW
MATTNISGPSVPAVSKADAGQYLTFMLGGETFAIGILRIKEIIEYGELTEVPMMPRFIRGVINLRGRVVPVVDLSARFGRATSQIARRTCIVIVETQGDGENAGPQDIGILVDAVNEVIEIGGADIEPAPSFGAKLRPEFISGMAKRNERFIILLQVDRVLSVDEMAALGQAFAREENGVEEVTV